jgi:hypothetical protein
VANQDGVIQALFAIPFAMIALVKEAGTLQKRALICRQNSS